MMPPLPEHGDQTCQPLLAPIAPGELLDKISILEIKSQRIDDRAKRENVGRELALLNAIRDTLAPLPQLGALTADLKNVNECLWDVEDAIRACESRQDFGPRFIDLARSVYRYNDRRAELKREINMLLGSRLIEEKAYVRY
jgi:hypothetical protein